MTHTPSIAKTLMLTTALSLALQVAPLQAATGAGEATWKPQATERLVKLPAQYLKKRLDHDFAESELGKALANQEGKIAGKGQTLADLQQAIGQADGELQTELRHQFLAEKRAYLNMMKDKNVLRRKKLDTDLKLYEGMLAKLSDKGRAATPAQRQLIKAQANAQERFKSSLSQVDMKMFQSSSVPESKYAVKYTENMAAIEKLVARIQGHKMNASPSTDGQPLTKAEYIRRMVTDAQAELAILDQEQNILGYMAKLVALDAMALSEEAIDADLADAETPGVATPASAVKFFVGN